MSNNKLHQRCHWQKDLHGTVDVSVCKAACDADINCKGYVEGKGSLVGSCQFATTSNCPSDYSQLGTGSVGDLDPNGTCGGYNFLGCFIKHSVVAIRQRKLNIRCISLFINL